MKRGARATRVLTLGKFYYPFPKSKRSQMQLSFGMVFSIILIIFFLAFAFYAIKIFLGTSETAKNAKFVENLQEDIDDLWKSPEGSKEKTYDLSSDIEEICFVDDEYENLIFLPLDSEELPPIILEHMDMSNITQSSGSEVKRIPVAEDYDRVIRALCFAVVDGEVDMILRKDFGKNFVVITK